MTTIKSSHTLYRRFCNLPTTTRLAYHVTERQNVPSILKQGLLPKTPTDMDDEEGVYLFPTYEDLQTALYNWMGERMEEIEEETGRTYKEVLLVIDIQGLSFTSDVEFELRSASTIPAHRILGELVESPDLNYAGVG
jgi:hypothetical protein